MADDPDDAIIRIPIEYELDLHAFAPRDIASVVDEFIRAAWSAGLRDLRLVHGRGRGVQRATVHRLLAQHPLVVHFRDDPAAHLGATLVELNRP
jgi:DNA-nicking Smr family endonuclease